MSEKTLIDSYAARRRLDIEEWAKEIAGNRETPEPPGPPVASPATQQPRADGRGVFERAADAIIPPDPNQGNYAQQVFGTIADRFEGGLSREPEPASEPRKEEVVIA